MLRQGKDLINQLKIGEGLFEIILFNNVQVFLEKISKLFIIQVMKNPQKMREINMDWSKAQNHKIPISNKSSKKQELKDCICDKIDGERISEKLREILIVLEQQIESKNREIQNEKKIKQEQIEKYMKTIEQLKMANIQLKNYNQSLQQEILNLKYKNQLKSTPIFSSKQISAKPRSPTKFQTKKSQQFISRRNGCISNKNIFKSIQFDQDKPNYSELMTADSEPKIMVDRFATEPRSVGKISKNGSYSEKKQNQHSRSQSSTNINSIPLPSSTTTIKKVKANQSQKYLQTNKKPITYKNSYLESMFYKPYIVSQKPEKKASWRIMTAKKEGYQPYWQTKNKSKNYKNESFQNKYKLINIKDFLGSSFIQSNVY